MLEALLLPERPPFHPKPLSTSHQTQLTLNDSALLFFVGHIPLLLLSPTSLLHTPYSKPPLCASSTPPRRTSSATPHRASSTPPHLLTPHPPIGLAVALNTTSVTTHPALIVPRPQRSKCSRTTLPCSFKNFSATRWLPNCLKTTTVMRANPQNGISSSKKTRVVHY